MKQKASSIPFFSVITPSFEQGKYLSRCLDSVIAQEDGGYEHWVIDNCSRDETGALLKKYHAFYDQRLSSQSEEVGSFFSFVEPDRGQSEAVNKGLRRARGEIICWLNSDDAYPPGTFAKLREYFANPEVMVVVGNVVQIVERDGEEVRELLLASWQGREAMIAWWHQGIQLHQPAIFFRRSVVEEVGLLREDLHYAMDTEYWWRLSEKYRFDLVEDVLALALRQPDSKTMQAWERVLEEREKIFAPFYSHLGKPLEEVHQERSRALARDYLYQAYAVGTGDSRKTSVAASRELLDQTLFYLQLAWQESPREVLKPQGWGVFKKVFEEALQVLKSF